LPSLFSNYLIVDWSAASTPKTGADSIWYAWIERHRDGHWKYEASNPSTRFAAAKEIRGRLIEAMRQSRATLAAFDFPLGYPRGAGPWREMWKRIAAIVRDEEDNDNNRFRAAASLNRKLKGPFWGRPASFAIPGLSPRKPAAASHGLPEMRYADAWTTGPQSPWKLYGAGSAGGQSLTGIPHLWRLREDRELSEHVRVWPFETGLAPPFGARPHQARIIFAEAWPSQLRPKPKPEEVKDQTQVRVMAEHFARLDQLGRLARLFAGPRELTGAQREAVEREEGWILGIL
jgi:hypothetical protein